MPVDTRRLTPVNADAPAGGAQFGLVTGRQPMAIRKLELVRPGVLTVENGIEVVS